MNSRRSRLGRTDRQAVQEPAPGNTAGIEVRHGAVEHPVRVRPRVARVERIVSGRRRQEPVGVLRLYDQHILRVDQPVRIPNHVHRVRDRHVNEHLVNPVFSAVQHVVFVDPDAFLPAPERRRRVCRGRLLFCIKRNLVRLGRPAMVGASLL